MGKEKLKYSGGGVDREKRFPRKKGKENSVLRGKAILK